VAWDHARVGSADHKRSFSLVGRRILFGHPFSLPEWKVLAQCCVMLSLNTAKCEDSNELERRNACNHHFF
jgi:hypothetical protein